MKEIVQLLLDSDQSIQPFTIELKESSGPVSPPYQFNTHIKIFSEKNKIILEYHHDHIYQQGIPQKTVHFNQEIPLDHILPFFKALSDFDFLKESKEFDFIGESKKKIGISFNTLYFNFSDKIIVHVQYLLSCFDEDYFVTFANAIEIIKNLKSFQSH